MINLKKNEINKKIFDIQKLWADNIVKIGKAYLENKDYVNITCKFLDDLYYFKESKILFKPTKASHMQFRKDKNEFISYFIGQNKISHEDKGFALEPWKNIYFENYDSTIFDNIIFSMGNYFFTDYKNNKIKVEYSFGYILEKKKNLKIIFHHSSLPYK